MHDKSDVNLSKRLRIFMVSSHERDPNAGAAGADIRLAKALRDRGHEVDLFFYEDVFLSKNIYGYWRQLLFPWAVARFFRKRHLEKPYDIVDCTAGNLWVIEKLLSLARYRIRPLLCVHSHLLEHFDTDLEKKAATLEGKKLSWKFRLYHAGYRLWEVVRDFKIADVVFVLNSQKRAYLVKEFDLPEEKLYVIPNGVGDHFIKKINGDNFNAEKLFRLLFIGGWTARKGIKILSQIVEVLFSFDERFRLTCAGVIESKEGVLRLFPKRFWGRIEVIPRFENKDLPGMMSHHGVFIFPSLLESFALSMLEAMVAGLIVVSTPVGAAPEVIISGKNGFLVPFNEAEAFIKTIKFIVAQGSLMKEISDNAKAAGMKFTWPNAARIREAIYINNLS